ncbi:WW domain-containing protein [Fusarium sp. LHS14.1]|nr:WW domain-containing protein [Fusarium sp. LHS14.1]
MSTPNLASPDPRPEASSPGLPPGWIANWSPEHNSWYYIFTATGVTQWEYQNAPSDQPQYSPTPDHQSQPSYDTPADTPVQDGDRGLGKVALAMGGGYLLGHGHKHEQHQQHGLGKMTQSMAMAGAGAIGAKIFGLFGNKQQQQHQASPPPQPQVHVYPVYVPGPQAAPSPGPPSYYGQPPPVGQNLGHYGGTPGTPGMTPPAQPYHHGGVQSPVTGGMGAFTPQIGPPLHIYGAVFADRDVTQIVKSLVTPQQTLTLSGDTLAEKLGDPWPEAERKMFNVLYSYGDRPMEVIAADTNTANIEIKHEAISRKRMEFCQPPPSRIIACVWGYENALTQPRI